MPSNYVLLYDGLCGFCNATVQFIIRHDKKKRMRFASIQSLYAAKIFEHHPLLKQIDSLILIEQSELSTEVIHIRSNAALTIASYLGGMWNFFLAAAILPRSLRDWLYDLFAAHRYKIFGKYDVCLLPPPDFRSFFLE